MSNFDIDQAKLFQAISLAVADATKEVLENEQATRIRDLQAEAAELRSVLDNAQVAQYALDMKARAEAAEAEVALLKHNDETEMNATLRLRAKYGAHNDETFPAFLSRLHKERKAAETKLRAVGELPRYHIVEGYLTLGDKAPDGIWVKYDELEALLKEQSENE